MPSVPLAVLAVFMGSAFAQTSLYIPGFDPQPISADNLGVDAQGRTTWALHQGALTGTFDDSGFVGTATLVEGPNDVSFTYVPPGGEFTVGRECSLSGVLAICSATISGEAITETETASLIEVQAGTTIPAASVSTGSPSPSPSGSPSPSKPAQTSDKTTSAPGPSNTSNGSFRLTSYLSGLFISAVSVAVFLQL